MNKKSDILLINGNDNNIKSNKICIIDTLKVINQINNMRNTIYSLEKSFHVSQCLEVEQWSRFRKMKTFNVKLSNDLKEVEQRNTTMLNLFRANVTCELPENIKNQIKQSWQQKYDALLKMNNQLRRETHLKDITIKEKNYEVNCLEQQLLNIGKKLIERDETMKNIYNKYLNLKKHKDEHEIILHGSIEALKDSSLLKKNNINFTSNMSRMSLMPTQEALLAYETRRNDRLTRENNILRNSLRQLRINNKCNNNNNSSDDIIS